MLAHGHRISIFVNYGITCSKLRTLIFLHISGVNITRKFVSLRTALDSNLDYTVINYLLQQVNNQPGHKSQSE